MGAITQIAWCDATFNPWVGCLRVSTGCDRCYAAALSWRYGWRDGNGRDLWDVSADRKRTSSSYWRGPLRWSERAQVEGTRRRVFCASMADVFDNQVPTSWRVDLWSLIRSTPALDWFLLTKRPQNIGDMLPTDWGDGWPQVWLGTTAENQEEANRRIPHLVAIPAAVRFLSVEPMVEPVDVAPWLAQPSHGAKALISWIIVKSPLIGRCSVDHLAHLIDTTARPRAPQPDTAHDPEGRAPCGVARDRAAIGMPASPAPYVSTLHSRSSRSRQARDPRSGRHRGVPCVDGRSLHVP